MLTQRSVKERKPVHKWFHATNSTEYVPLDTVGELVRYDFLTYSTWRYEVRKPYVLHNRWSWNTYNKITKSFGVLLQANRWQRWRECECLVCRVRQQLFERGTLK